MASVSKKTLEMYVEKVGGYTRPKLDLEQYVTDSRIVAEIVWRAGLRGEVSGMRILDSGCGTGRFSAASALLGALQVLCIDIDYDAILDALRYIKLLNIDHVVDVVVADMARPPLARSLDTAFQNPPFGIWSGKGSDIRLLASVVNLVKVAYSIHKAATEGYVKEFLRRMGYEVFVEFRAKITLPHVYRHHRKPRRSVEVSVIRVYKP